MTNHEVPIGLGIVNLELEQFNYNVNDSLNILIVADGYPESKRSRFNQDVNIIINGFNKSPPFSLKSKKHFHSKRVHLKDKINFYSIFIPIEHQTAVVTQFSGIPFELNRWSVMGNSWVSTEENTTKTIVGSKYAYYDPTNAPTGAPKVGEFSIGINHDRVMELIDFLQMGKAQNFVFLQGQISQILVDLKQYWYANPEMIVVLVFDDFHCSRSIPAPTGSRMSGKSTAVVCRGDVWFKNEKTSYFTGGDTTLPKNKWTNRIPGSILNVNKEMIGIFIHEFGHAFFGLADEYEKSVDTVWGKNNNLNPKATYNIAKHGNVQSLLDIALNKNAAGTQATTDKINPNDIAWIDWKIFPGSPDDVIHPDVKSYMMGSNDPLSINQPGTSNNRFLAKQFPDVPPSGSPLPNVIKTVKHKYKSAIIGLYEGGYLKTDNVFRPTGLCLMRVIWDVPVPSGSSFVLKKAGLPLCYICKYITLEKIISHCSMSMNEKKDLFETLAARWPPNYV